MKIDTMRIWQYSHHFVVVCGDANAIRLAMNFSRRFIKTKLVYENGRYREVPDIVFALANKDKNRFRFHINVLYDFIREIERYYGAMPDEVREIIDVVPLYTPQKVDLIFREGWEDKPNQVEPIQWGLDQLDNKANTLLYIWQMGHGKSYMLARCAQHTGGRIVLFIQPRYVEKWIVDFTKMFELDPKDVPYYYGSGMIMDLTNSDWNHKRYPIVMISIDSYIDWIELYKENNYESLEQFGYGIDPPLLLEHLGAGAYMRDEVHETFYRMFCIDLFTHAPVSLNATATLISDNQTIRDAHKIMFPIGSINEQEELDIYVDVITAKFKLIEGNKIRTTEARCKMHSGAAIEKNLLKNTKALRGYINMLVDLITRWHLDRAKKGDKCIIYFAYTKFIDYAIKELKKKFKDVKFDRYTKSDPYSNLLNADICLTTKKRAGTAVDVPGLLTVIDGHIQKTSVGIIQNLGRLRIRGDKQSPRYVRIVCTDWLKHLEYFYHARSLLRSRVNSESVDNLGFVE